MPSMTALLGYIQREPSRLKYSKGGSVRGNALFLILIAVALFAALSYAISTSGRGSGSIEKEKSEIVRAQLVQIGAAMSQAILRMRINGCRDTEISVENGGTNVNASTPSDGSCKLFDPNGGGLAPMNTGPYAANIEAFPVAGAGDPQKADIVAEFGPLTETQCRAFNRRFGLGDADPLEYDMFACSAAVEGSFVDTCPTPNFTELAPAAAADLCLDITPGFGFYYYFHVVMAR